MAPPSPSAGVALTGNLETDKSFRQHMRKRDADYEALRQHNFDLQLKIHHLEKELREEREEIRRLSASPGPDNFYGSDDDTELDPRAASKTSTRFDNRNPVVAGLKAELLQCRAENDRLTEQKHQIEDDYHDLLEKKKTDELDAAKKADAQIQNVRAELQSFVNQTEDLQSENMKHTAELKRMEEALEASRREGEEREIAEGKSKARADGYRVQFKAMVTAYEEQCKTAESAQEKLGEASIELRRITKELKEAREAAEELIQQHDDGARKITQMEKDLNSARIERDVARATLKAEKGRAQIWAESGDLLQSDTLLLSSGSNALEDLIALLQRQKEAYDTFEEYQPQWRNQVVSDMNECLRALYRSQREVEARREQFVQSYCQSDPSFEAAPAIHQTCAVPTG